MLDYKQLNVPTTCFPISVLSRLPLQLAVVELKKRRLPAADSRLLAHKIWSSIHWSLHHQHKIKTKRNLDWWMSRFLLLGGYAHAEITIEWMTTIDRERLTANKLILPICDQLARLDIPMDGERNLPRHTTRSTEKEKDLSISYANRYQLDNWHE